MKRKRKKKGKKKRERGKRGERKEEKITDRSIIVLVEHFENLVGLNKEVRKEEEKK